MPTGLPELKFYSLVETRHRAAGPVHAQVDVFPACVEFRLHDQSVGIFDRKTMRVWLDAPGRPLQAGQTSLAVGDKGRLDISIGQDVIHSPLPERTTEQLNLII